MVGSAWSHFPYPLKLMWPSMDSRCNFGTKSKICTQEDNTLPLAIFKWTRPSDQNSIGLRTYECSSSQSVSRMSIVHKPKFLHDTAHHQVIHWPVFIWSWTRTHGYRCQVVVPCFEKLMAFSIFWMGIDQNGTCESKESLS